MSPVRRFAPLLALLLLALGCNSLNPLCGSARPVPALSSLSPTTVAFSATQSGFTLVLTGGKFVASSIAVVNGVNVVTTVNSSSQITADVPPSVIPGPGSYNVQVKTPAGNSGDLGCSSGGMSAILTLTIT